jgi:hypothetical protein
VAALAQAFGELEDSEPVDHDPCKFHTPMMNREGGWQTLRSRGRLRPERPDRERQPRIVPMSRPEFR